MIGVPVNSLPNVFQFLFCLLGGVLDALKPIQRTGDMLVRVSCLAKTAVFIGGEIPAIKTPLLINPVRRDDIRNIQTVLLQRIGLLSIRGMPILVVQRTSGIVIGHIETGIHIVSFFS